MNVFFFFFNDTATTEIYTLSLHDALPIYSCARGARRDRAQGRRVQDRRGREGEGRPGVRARRALRCGAVHPVRRSEEHTSELQSQSNLVCRLLLEKKNTHSR